MNEILGMLGSVFDFLETLFERGRIFSIILGLFVGIGLTQASKFPLYRRIVTAPVGSPLRPGQEMALRWYVRVCAILTTAIATAFTWPGDVVLGIWIGLANGAMCPFTYLLFMKAIGRWLPWLSVTRRPDDPPVL